jgi:hypothetical protein
VICESPAKTVAEFILSVGDEEFFTVEEFYRDNVGNYFSAGMVALNVAHIGKIKMDKEK